MQAVRVLRRVDAFQNRRLVDAFGQRQLDDVRRADGVGVQTPDGGRDLVEAGGCRQVLADGADADVGAIAPLAGYLSEGAGVLPDQQHAQAWDDPARGERHDPSPELFLQFRRACRAVDSPSLDHCLPFGLRSGCGPRRVL